MPDVITLPKGGGAMQGIGEKFTPDLHTGTGNFTVPIALPPGRNGFQPQLNLVYSTGNGNGPFGLGWSLSIPGVSRKTSQGVPQYHDYDPSEMPGVFILSGAEDLVPVGEPTPGVTRYRPRTEGLFAQIYHHHDAEGDYWQVRSKDGLVSLYGTKGKAGADPATIADPDPSKNGRVFAWKLTQTSDPFGNLILYDYGERDQGNQNGRLWDQPLLSRIRYVDYDDTPQFLVSVTFAYEERTDTFSDYRAGFEIRWSKRCSAITIKTHADQERTVRQYRFEYEYDSWNGISLLKRVHLIGYDDDGNAYDAEEGDASTHKRQLPPLEFGYTRFAPQERKFQAVQGTDLPASSLANPNLELVDLHGNGLPDILEMDGAVRYWRNLGGGCFDLPRPMREAPAHALSDPGVQMIDANGDGRMDLMVTNGPLAGYYPLTYNASWDRRSFQKYKSPPGFNLEDPEVRLIDLDGDGVTDAIRSGTSLECVYNDPHAGWSSIVPVHRKSLDVFPNINFSDPRVKWGDMTGDNLQDIVLVYDGNVEYWPNLGYGQWGKRIDMQNSPKFRDYGYTFGYDPRRILLGDVDGDGLADIVYIGNRQVTLWINQSGNRWSDPIVIQGTPPTTDMDAVRLLDLLGTGVSGVLWSADANSNGRPHMYFLDFTGGVKPYVMNEMDNHMGATTRVQYAPSTRFYLEDAKKPATRWKTPLPFPVQVVERVEVIDAISRGKLTTEYRYHHGYWDGAEREFRGFGMVEQLDTEMFERYNATGLHGDEVKFAHVHDDPAGALSHKQFFSQPTLTRTWFHQGPVGEEFGDWQELDRSAEYWQGDPGLLDHTGQVNRFLAGYLDSPKSRRIKRDALRALRGSVLRSELYALDRFENQDKVGPEDRPYTVTEYAYDLTEILPPAAGKEDRLHIFFPHAIAQRTTQWERGSEPMTQFSFTSDYDSYGQPHSQISIAVPRGRDPMQTIAAGAPAPHPYLATHAVSDYAQRDDRTIFVVDRVARVTTFEIQNDGLASVLDLKRTIESKALDDAKAIISQTVNYYDGSSFVGLPYQQIGRYGALVRSEQLVLTLDILQHVYQSGRPLYLNPTGVNWTNDYPAGYQTGMANLAGYLYCDGLTRPEHTQGYFAVTAQREYDFHRSPHGDGQGLILTQRDPLNHETQIEYEYQLLPNKVTDAVELTTTVQYNYRVMQPRLVTDPNGNTTEFSFTPIGLVSQIFGRDKSRTGDLNNPSTRFEYDFLVFERGRQDGKPNPQPIEARTIRRVHHDGEANVPASEHNETIEAREYSDGFGRLIQTRVQAEDVIFGDSPFGGGVLPVDQSDPATAQTVTGTRNANRQDPNVVVSGWQIYDNKGRVVEKYEPFFDTGWDFASPTNAQRGEKAAVYYDPRGQMIRTVNPDHSEQRVFYGKPRQLDNPDVYDPTPWEAYTYDVNDNAGRTHAGDPRAMLCQHHWNTPANILIDALGRTTETVERNRRRLANGSWSAIEEYHTKSTYDIRGNVLTITDALGRVAFRHEYDLANRTLKILSIDAGTRLSVFDAAGNLVERRDSKSALELSSYDVLNRPIRLWARDQAGQGVTLRQRLIYGDDLNGTGLTRAQTANRNLFGRLYRHYDEAGLLQMNRYDFKGNLVDKSRRVIRDTSIANNWRANWEAQGSANALEPTGRAYQTSSSFDALNRPKEIIYPKDVKDHRAVLKPIYNRAGALEQVKLDGVPYVERIAYNAKGQRVLIAYGNRVMTRYAYDPHTFRLARLRTEHYKSAGALQYPPGPLQSAAQREKSVLQDLAYEYDLAGNIISIHDRTPRCGLLSTPDQLDRDFIYDPLYRLMHATGRECDLQPPNPPWKDIPKCTDLTRTRFYAETYTYDPAGNMERFQHSAGSRGDFTRRFTLAPGNNRLATVSIGNRTFAYIYDDNGNLISEGLTRHFTWNHADQMIVFTDQNGRGRSVEARYLYDAGGMRVKKWVRTNGTGAGESTTTIDGIFEHHLWQKAGQSGENNHLHVMDDQSRVALKRVGAVHPNDRGPDVQYHLGDHLGSSSVVVGGTNAQANAFINREQYYPYGETSFGSFGKKRYRFTGKERDDESGLYYHGARYYASWLGRWTSCDPAGMIDGLNLYIYVNSDPINGFDLEGLQTENKEEQVRSYPTVSAANSHHKVCSACHGSDGIYDIPFVLPDKQPVTFLNVDNFDFRLLDQTLELNPNASKWNTLKASEFMEMGPREQHTVLADLLGEQIAGRAKVTYYPELPGPLGIEVERPLSMAAVEYHETMQANFMMLSGFLMYGSYGGRYPLESGMGVVPSQSQTHTAVTRGEVGLAREQYVARMVGGVVTKNQKGQDYVLKVPSIVGKSLKLDVVGRYGEFILVGGPGKAGNLSQAIESFVQLRRYSDYYNARPMAFFQKGTSKGVLRQAERVLGKENVKTFSLPQP